MPKLKGPRSQKNCYCVYRSNRIVAEVYENHVTALVLWHFYSNFLEDNDSQTENHRSPFLPEGSCELGISMFTPARVRPTWLCDTAEREEFRTTYRPGCFLVCMGVLLFESAC